jgi:hypothetical protein
VIGWGQMGGTVSIWRRCRVAAQPSAVPNLETALLVSRDPCQQISQAVSRENHPPISNPARTNNVAHRKHRGRCDHRAVFIPAFRTSDRPAVAISDLRRNLEALFCPRLEITVRKFGKLTPLKLLAVSKRRGCFVFVIILLADCEVLTRYKHISAAVSAIS